MTSFVATQSTLASSLVYGTCSRINIVNQFATPQYLPIRLQRNATSLVRCMARDNEEEQKTSRPKVGAEFSDILAFGGPAPERINGRLAMIGFVAALTVELSNGQDVFAQISNGGIPWFVGTSVVLTLASLIPLFKGVSVESKSKGIMTSDAEMWNGRLAMLGLVALAFTEFVKGGALA